jgi:hypothetical protein
LGQYRISPDCFTTIRSKRPSSCPDVIIIIIIIIIITIPETHAVGTVQDLARLLHHDQVQEAIAVPAV